MNQENKPRLIMTEDDIARTLHRMAHEIWEQNAGDELALVGIRSRGVPLANRLRTILSDIAKKEIPLGILDIGLYRDDIGLSDIAPALQSTDIPFAVDGLNIIMIDDVLFTGRTVRAALNGLMDLGRPNRVQLLVLLDRGHRELPIQADYIGYSIKTGMAETIKVHVREHDGDEGVFIIRND